MDKNKQSEKRAIQKLEQVCKYWFLRNLKSGITPIVMGCLPDPVKAEINYCSGVGIPKKQIDYVIGSAWRETYQKYSQ